MKSAGKFRKSEKIGEPNPPAETPPVWEKPRLYLLLAAFCAVFGTICYFASLNATATTLLDDIGINAFTTAQQLAVGLAACLVMAVSPTVRRLVLAGPVWLLTSPAVKRRATVVWQWTYKKLWTDHAPITQIDRKNNFDALRLLLALFVLYYHSWALTGKEQAEPMARLLGFSLYRSGVPLFFVLSGFLIVRSWEQSRGAWDYLKRRILRIYPAFIAVCVIAGLLASLYSKGVHNWIGYLGATLLLNQPVIAGSFGHNPVHNVNASLWTIQWEFGCYLGVLAIGLCSRRNAKYVIGVMWIILAAYMRLLYTDEFPRLGAWVDRNWLHWETTFLPFCFATGAVFWLWRARIRHSLPLAIVLCLGSILLHHQEFFWPFPWGYLALVAGLQPKLPLYKFTNKIGDLSYGTYAWAFFIQQMIIQRYGGHMSAWFLFVLAVPISLACAYVSWHLIEKPAMALKARRRAVSSPASTAREASA